MKAIYFMAKNKVAANLLMMFFLVGGLLGSYALVVEVFPEIELDRVMISVAYPGAGPEEVEQGIVTPIEEAVQGLDGVRRVVASAQEGAGVVTIEVLESADIDEVLQDIKSAVDRIVTFPEEAERPVVKKLVAQRAVLTVVVFGDLDQHQLRQQAEQVRDDLLAKENITQAALTGVPPYEISVEIDEATLRRYRLTLDGVAAIIRRSSLDLPAGGVKTKGGEILLRTKERAYTAREYERVVVVSKPDGTLVRLGDIAKVRDTFAETDEHASYNGKPAAMVNVNRVGEQDPTDISQTVRAYLAQRREALPANVGLEIWFDRSEILQSRLDLLTRNLTLGLMLVILVLGLFLELKLAFWVTMGIPISMLGALVFMPSTGVTINMLSLFAFILVLGIVVDDAIVVGENAYYHRTLGKPFWQAAADGAIEVGRPVTFSILTTIAAFAPLLFVTGVMGKFMYMVPVIVIAVLAVSLIESLFVLPAHLSKEPTAAARQRRPGPIRRLQLLMTRGLFWVIDHPYTTTLRIALRYRHAVVALAIASLLVTVGFIRGGHIKFVFLPELESDVIRAKLVMPFGTPVAATEKHIKRMKRVARALVTEYDAAAPEGKSILRSVSAVIGSTLGSGGPHARGGSKGSHLGEVAVFLVDSGQRGVSSSTFAREWRKRVGEVPGAQEVDFQAELMRVGDPIAIQLAHEDFDTLQRAANRIKARLREYPGVHDIADSFEQGKRELKLQVTPTARALGVTATDLALQVRGAFYGAEALRLQRGRNEVKVMVRYPERERRSMANVSSMRIRAPGGGEIPFFQAASVVEGRGYARISRTDRKRTVTVVAKANPKVSNPNEVVADVQAQLLPQLLNDYPGMSYDLEGEMRERNESMSSLGFGFLAALGIIFCLLAIPFRSYGQPLIIMTAIPFGVIGAVIGHVLLGYNISMMSLFGVAALTGVVVNDSLVLVDFVNRYRADRPMVVAVLEACKRRFRPILLTTLTTFFALVPMLAETSVQARFLVPMAISLGFGVLFATAITLVLIPVLYVVLEDLKNLGRWLVGRETHPVPVVIEADVVRGSLPREALTEGERV